MSDIWYKLGKNSDILYKENIPSKVKVLVWALLNQGMKIKIK